MPPAPILVAALAIVAAAAFALGVQDGHWWSIGEVRSGRSARITASAATCRATGLAWIGGERPVDARRDRDRRGAACSHARAARVARRAVAAGRFPTLAGAMPLVAIVTATRGRCVLPVAGSHGVDGAQLDRAPVPRIVLCFGAIPLGLARGAGAWHMHRFATGALA